MKSGFFLCATSLVFMVVFGCAAPEMERVEEANTVFPEVPVTEEAEIPPSLLSLPPGFEELRSIQEQPPAGLESKPKEDTPEILELSMPQTEGAVIKIVKPPETVGEVTSAPEPSEMSIIRDMQVSEMNGKTWITLYADKTPAFEVKRSAAPPRLTIDLQQSILLPKAKKVIIPDALDTLVKRVRIFQARRKSDDSVVRILVDLIRLTKHEVIIYPDKFILNVKHPTIGMTELAPRESEKMMKVPLLIGIEKVLAE